jgi:class 3 adenylate cyclase
MAQTEGSVLVQYVFLDVVRFTEGRTIEAQVDVVTALNSAVRAALDTPEIPPEARILLPTGDGLAIALLQPPVFDLALKLAQAILQAVHTHNSATGDPRRRFEVRIGINQNIDNLVTDINGNRNIAGRGINQAQRIMSNADGRQILIGASLYEILCEREAYAGSFRELPGKDKHGNRFSVYQLVQPSTDWLETYLPSKFRPVPQKTRQLSEYAAHYLASAYREREFLLARRRDIGFDYTAQILLHLLALDSMDDMRRSPLEEGSHRVERSPDGSPEPAYKAIAACMLEVRSELASHLAEKLTEAADCFEAGEYGYLWAFPSASGVRRAKSERPDIWRATTGEEPPTPEGSKTTPNTREGVG